MSDHPRMLIAGVGNIFLGDDAFGVEVARRLAQRQLPSGVRVVDFGIRGIDLTYALLDGYDTVILVDAAPRGQPPGTLYVIEPEREETGSIPHTGTMVETHGMDPAKVLRLATAMGSPVRRVLLVGCEPAKFGDDGEMSMELSEPVRAAVNEAVHLIESLITKLLSRQQRSPLAHQIDGFQT